MKHGTRAAIRGGCVCDGCRLMTRLYAKTGPVFAHETPNGLRPAEPFRVVLDAIVASGRTVAEVARFCDVAPKTLYRIVNRECSSVTPDVSARLGRMVLLLPSAVVT